MRHPERKQHNCCPKPATQRARELPSGLVATRKGPGELCSIFVATQSRTKPHTPHFTQSQLLATFDTIVITGPERVRTNHPIVEREMKILRALWRDEAGVILSAETVVVGTVAVLGLSAGLSVVATSVGEELKEVGFSIRSLDQSYRIPAQQGTCAYVAGSSYQQPPVEESLERLCAVAEEAEHAEREHHERVERAVERREREMQEGRERNVRREQTLRAQEVEARKHKERLEEEVQMLQQRVREMQGKARELEKNNQSQRRSADAKRRAADAAKKAAMEKKRREERNKNKKPPKKKNDRE